MCCLWYHVTYCYVYVNILIFAAFNLPLPFLFWLDCLRVMTCSLCLFVWNNNSLSAQTHIALATPRLGDVVVGPAELGAR